MENENKIKTVLDFYTKVNSLKNVIIDQKNNQSLANYLFGTMIIATAMDSEFKETNDLAKVYRMLLLSEINYIDPKYNFEDLKKSDQFQKELEEAGDFESKNAKLLFKYKIINNLLSSLINDKNEELSFEEMIKEGTDIISKACKNNSNCCEEIFKYYYYNYNLNNKVRSAWDDKHWKIKTDRIERVSEHVIDTLGLAIGLYSEFDYDYDFNKVLKTLVIHETGEAKVPDFTPFDGKTQEEKIEIEHNALKEVIGGLKNRQSLIGMLYDFDEAKLPESEFAYLCDKMVLNLQAKIYQEEGMQRPLDDQKDNIVFQSPRIQEFIKNGATEPFDIFYEWDRSKFENNSRFPEFEEMFKWIKQNQIIDTNYKKSNKQYSLKI